MAGLGQNAVHAPEQHLYNYPAGQGYDDSPQQAAQAKAADLEIHYIIHFCLSVLSLELEIFYHCPVIFSTLLKLKALIARAQ
jgi:hypothetical protein